MQEQDASSQRDDRPDAAARSARVRRIIVAGYGPVGRTVAEQLEEAGAQVTIIDANVSTIERQQALDKHVVHGDVRDPEVLRAAGIDSADALILAIPDEREAVAACGVARKLNPHIYLAARTNFVSQGLLAREAGADHVVIEEIATAEAMQRAVMQQLLGEKNDEPH